MLNNKICTRCYEEKPLDQYYTTNKTNSKGEEYAYYFPYCKECNIKSSGEWSKTNPSRRSEAVARYDKTRREELDMFRKKYRETGKQLRWQRNNKNKIKEYNSKRQNKKHNISTEEWNGCLNFFNNRCAYCGIHQEESKVKYKNHLHKEHVIHDGSNEIDNCIPACKGCNASKGTKEFDSWYNKENYRFTQARYDDIQKWLESDCIKYKRR